MRIWSSVFFWLTLALATALCWPLSKVFWFETHEANEYVTRTVEYLSAIRHGDLYPRWLSALYGGYGSPFANFYAPGVYWLAAIFAAIWGSPTAALKVVIVLGAWLGAGSVFALVRQETNRDEVAWLGACAFTTAPYRLADVSWRGDLAELLALNMLPAAIYGYRRILRASPAQRTASAVLVTVLAHAGMVASHTLIGLWGTGMIVVVLLLSAYPLLRGHALPQALPLGIAFIASLLTSSIYTLPALLEKKFVRTESMIAGGYEAEHHAIHWSALFAPSGLQFGPLLLCATAAVGLGWYLQRRPARGALAWLLGALALTSLTLPFASPLWAADVIPFGAYIQFPWRLLGLATLCAAVALALAWAHAFPARRVAALAAAPVVGAAVVLGLPYCELKPMAPASVVLSSERIASAWMRGTGLDEYLPRAVTQPAMAPAIRVAESTEDVKVEIQESGGTQHVLKLDAARAVELELKLHSFPGWQATTQQGSPPVRLGSSARGLVSLQLPAPGRYVVHVGFGSTPVRRAALALSLLGLLAAWRASWLTGQRPRRDTEQAARSRTPEAV